MTSDFHSQRQRMVDEQIVARGVRDPRVVRAFRNVPRHMFIDPAYWPEAYDDHPVTIGEGQTISQPYMVALMTEELAAGPEHKVLEIGTGSGYQTAILAEIAKQVCTVERHKTLSGQAALVLDELGYTNIRFRVGDGTLGWPEEAPFDRIIVTAGGPMVPQSLVDQLAVGGRMVIPVGSTRHQSLTIVTRTERGVQQRTGSGCVFVKLIGAEGWEAEAG